MKGLFALVLAAVAGTAGAIDGPATVPLEPDHCLGVIWSRRGVIDLAAMLDPVCAPYMADLYFEANGERCENNRLVLSYWCPGSLEPDIYYVTLRKRNVSRPLDAMWIVANAPLALSRFNAWVSNNVSTAWTSALPKPFASIAVTNGVATDPEPPGPDGRPGTWDAPHRIDPTSYLHHNAVWEMRTTVEGEHGNQATYDEQGSLIRMTIAAGTDTPLSSPGVSSAFWVTPASFSVVSPSAATGASHETVRRDLRSRICSPVFFAAYSLFLLRAFS